MAKRIRIRRKAKRGAPAVRHSASGAAHMQSKEPAGGLMIGGAHDPAEKAADAMASRALAGPGFAGGLSTSPASGSAHVHRKCAACEAEDKGGVHRSAQSGAIVAPGAKAQAASSTATQAITSLGAGRPLSPSERGFFEPRFGQDFSSVRVHDGLSADKAARGIDAEAFTHGSDVAFASGRNTPETMAHELAHVAQGDTGARRVVRRYTLASANHPTDTDYKAIPTAHKPRVKKAMKVLERAFKFNSCKNYFETKCNADAGNAVKRAEIALDKANVYHHPTTDKGSFGLSTTRKSDAAPREVAYTTTSYNQGYWEVAGVLTHELFHTCIKKALTNEEVAAQMAVEACQIYTPRILSMSKRSGKVGDTIVISGLYVGQKDDSKHSLFLNGKKVPTTYWKQDSHSAVTIKFKVPAGAKSGKLLIKAHGIPSGSRKFIVIP